MSSSISNICPPPLDHMVNFIPQLSLNGFAEYTARNYISAIGTNAKSMVILTQPIVS